jgi:DNA repair protein RecO (recombination protein O)
MPGARSYKTQAIVLKQMKLGEADKILTLYTPDFGKVRAVAKGVRRPASKLGGHLDLLTCSELMLAHGRNLDIVTQAQTIEAFMPMKSDLARLSAGFYVAELVDAFTDERMESPAVYRLALEVLRRLSEAPETECALRYFELQLVHYLGYRPELRNCATCHEVLVPATNYFHPASGGVLCPRCSYDKPLVRPLSLNAFKVLRLWQECDYATASRVRLDASLAREIEMVMRIYIRFLLEREVKATAWLDKLKQEEPGRPVRVLPQPTPEDAPRRDSASGANGAV